MKIIFILWQLPQYFVGFLLYLLLRFFNALKKTADIFVKETGTIKIVENNFKLSVSFGLIIFVRSMNEQLIKHEIGHSIQSLLLGWLYLPLVGIPSVILNLFCRLGIINPNDYYRYYPESWADRLGGVKRICNKIE
jgi:hypothetical protein